MDRNSFGPSPRNVIDRIPGDCSVDAGDSLEDAAVRAQSTGPDYPPRRALVSLGLLPEPLRSRVAELTESQLFALRFASDAEVPGLVQRTLNEKLAAKQIKEMIRDWRPDHWRV
jgi:hypothetical protein